MKRVTITRAASLTICLVSVALLFSASGPLFAQEEARPTAPMELPAVLEKKGPNETEALREQKEALRKQIEELGRRLDEIKKKSLRREETAPRFSGRVESPAETTTIAVVPSRPAAYAEVPESAPTPPVSLRAVATASGRRGKTSLVLGPAIGESRVVTLVGPGKRGIELRKQELERVMRSHGDKGLVTLLRFEKAKVCRKAGMYDEAVNELQKIIEENLADETTNAARWTLVEILQERKKNEEAMAELEKIFVSASDTQDKMDAIYGIINLSGEGPKARIQAIERLIQALIKDQANWDGCMKNLEQLYAAERKYAEDHDGHLSEKLSDLYPDYVDNLEVFTCPASDDPKITRKEDIDSLTSYILVAKGQPVEGAGGKVAALPGGALLGTFPGGGRPRDETWIREKEQNHGRRWLRVSSNGAVGWFTR